MTKFFESLDPQVRAVLEIHDDLPALYATSVTDRFALCRDVEDAYARVADLDEDERTPVNAEGVRDQLDTLVWTISKRGDVWTALHAMDSRLADLERSLDGLVHRSEGRHNALQAKLDSILAALEGK